jgi:hypothetical protein
METETFDFGQMIFLGIAAIVIFGAMGALLAWRRHKRSLAEEEFADEEHRKESDEHLHR